MSSHFIGRFVSDGFDAQGRVGRPLIGFRITLHGPQSLIGSDALGSTVITHVDGLVEFNYRRDSSTEGHRTLEVTVEDLAGRRIPFKTSDGREVMDDRNDETLSRAADYVVREADAYGLLVTLGTGETSIQSPNGFGWGFKAGNRVTTLMDEDAFRHATKLMREAKQAIAMSQLFFPLPEAFIPDPNQEPTKLIFDFKGTQPDAQSPRIAGSVAGDARPERLLVDAAARGVDVRIVLNAVKVPLFVKIAVGAVLLPLAGSEGIRTAAMLDEEFTDADEVDAYFAHANAAKIRTAPFEQPVLTTAGVMHAKLVVADWTYALSIGSPFGQSYFDTHDHEIDAPCRGGSDGFPKHDAGFAISGPAVAHLQETLKLLWDTVRPNDKLTSFPGPTEPIGDSMLPGSGLVPAAAPSTADLDAALAEDGECDVQIVRTISSGRFKDVPGIPEDGEKGILEAYQRAIAGAEDFVYIETQYFTNDAIGEAIVGAIKARRNRPSKADGTPQPDLQVIVVCNIAPDVPFYPFKQRRLIHRIREAIGEDASKPKWFGVFTRWSHDVPPDIEGHLPSRPRMLPIYVHAKAAVVDNQWATIGSANLDGLSLDSMLLWDKLNGLLGFDLFRQQRAIEVNGCFINSDGASPVVDKLRRKLWAEHLGFMKSAGVPDIDASELATRPAGGWLSLWNERAAANLQRLIDTPKESFDNMARVLPWPKQNTTYKTPRKHLDALGIKTYKVVPLRSTRKFDFKLGDWDKKSRAEMDYD
jgi:phosphatidylserine/phosphatidylglycerophosphate/cardiolipin synthase-like enzyme